MDGKSGYRKIIFTGLMGLALMAPSAGWAQDDWKNKDKDKDKHERDDQDRDGQDRKDRERDARRDDDQNGNYRRTNTGTSASDIGYRDGLTQGRLDRQNNANRNYRNRDYLNGDRGYQRNGNMGNRGQYKKAYREGYQRGYEEGYAANGGNGRWGRRPDRNGYPNNGYPNGTGYPNNGYPNNGGSSALIQAAQDNGYRDGVYYGQQDRNTGHSNRPTEVKGYKDADHGYTSSLGSQAEFKQVYRQAFMQGYQSGYGSTGYRQ